MAAFEGTSGFYMRGRELAHRDIKDRTTEVWGAPGGLLRIEYWEEGRLQNWQVMGADFEACCDPDHQWAEVYDLPRTETHGASYQLLEHIREMVALRGKQTGTTTVREWREVSLWGGEVDIIEATEPLEDPDEGWRKMRWEAEAATGRLLCEKHWRTVGGRWKLVAYSEEVAWDVDIPRDTWTFVPPEGWRVEYHRWWTGRVENTLASGQTQDWQVTLHAMDMNKNGDLILTWSRLPSREVADRLDGRVTPFRISAADDLGVTYEQDGGKECMRGRYGRDYLATTLRRAQSATPPGLGRTVTLTIHVSMWEPYADQVVTFADLPLPPRQDKVDVFEPEIVEY